MKRMPNSAINRSKSEKNDEHYTQLAGIGNEVRHYRDQFRGKTVAENCQILCADCNRRKSDV